mmetsp:Transcript_84725/g.236466  ORF Transcript_84725/g.236466 Transcript_84725/m.236466 type:complete len:259 (-) Transcript_84725:165-941(-)
MDDLARTRHEAAELDQKVDPGAQRELGEAAQQGTSSQAGQRRRQSQGARGARNHGGDTSDGRSGARRRRRRQGLLSETREGQDARLQLCGEPCACVDHGRGQQDLRIVGHEGVLGVQDGLGSGGRCARRRRRNVGIRRGRRPDEERVVRGQARRRRGRRSSTQRGSRRRTRRASGRRRSRRRRARRHAALRNLTMLRRKSSNLVDDVVDELVRGHQSDVPGQVVGKVHAQQLVGHRAVDDAERTKMTCGLCQARKVKS